MEDGGSPLSGYGVQLAVKNSEYKAIDDTQIKGTSVHSTECKWCNVSVWCKELAVLKKKKMGQRWTLRDLSSPLSSQFRNDCWREREGVNVVVGHCMLVSPHNWKTSSYT